MDYEIVAAERASGHLCGVDYGSSIRVLLRSPDKVLFSGCGGLHAYTQRNSGHDHYNQHRRVFSADGARVSNELIDKASKRIDEIFGEGATAVVKAAWKAKGTALVDGGGEKLAIPRAEAAADYERRRQAATCSWSKDLSGRIPTCKQCGKELRPHGDHHRMGHIIGDDHPKTAEDCQRLTNQEVVTVVGYHDEERWGYVEWFTTWDGQSTEQTDFCSDKCAAIYGRRAAAELPLLTPGGEPPKREHQTREYLRHGVPEVENTFTLKDGTVLRA